MDRRLSAFAIAPGAKVKLAALDAGVTGGLTKAEAESELAEHVEVIAQLQSLLYAEKRQALVVVLQGMDTAGKDGTITKVFARVNPMGAGGVAFKVPSAEELAHDFLWRVHREMPARGHLALFNRSHYEDIIAVRVRKLLPKAVWSARYEQINTFEALIQRWGCAF